LVLFAAAFAVYWAVGEEHANVYNYYVRLADAFLHGRLYLTESFSWLNELVPYDNGTIFYVVYPPLPAILMTPLVAVFGLSLDQALVSFFAGALTVVAAYFVAKSALRKLDGAETRSNGIFVLYAVMFGFGTLFVWLASTGSVWLIAQVFSALFLFLAIYEAFTRKRPLIMGLLLGASFWCRLPTIMGVFFFAGLIVSRQPSQELKMKLRGSLWLLMKLALGVGVFVVLDMAYNYVRFGAFFDVAYWMIPGILNEPWFSHGFFSLQYIPENLLWVLAGIPAFTTTAPFIEAPMRGLAIWVTTPVFLFALKAKMKDAVTLSAWAAIFAIAFVVFTKGVSGWGWGYRYAMDFYPFLYLLTVRGIGEKIRWYHVVLIVFGVVINLWGTIAINKFPGVRVLF
jgi:hypothetical protein